MNDNLVFLNESDLDKPIYRIFSFDRLIKIFQQNKITLVKPKLWDDPFENFILNSTGTLPDGREFQMSFRENYYGQCWSLTKESDAMWRIYSPEKDGVKVKTTIRKLFTPLFETGGVHRKLNGNLYNLSSFVGKVKYKGTRTLMEMLKDRDRMSNKIYDTTGRGQASTFYFKRWAFRHENEIRIMYHQTRDIGSNFFSFNINANDLFDEIVFDPRMDFGLYSQRKRQLQDSFNFDKKIIQSGLYKIKEFRIELNQI
ncbi:DUF2971 domain-containing protein [Draconibacterium sp.]|uniref:DUF2971 domain-containing protein n=1 Tax=Draconibacterium sp. TaxID=1965318 RepID=UPI003564F0B6